MDAAIVKINDASSDNMISLGMGILRWMAGRNQSNERDADTMYYAPMVAALLSGGISFCIGEHWKGVDVHLVVACADALQGEPALDRRISLPRSGNGTLTFRYAIESTAIRDGAGRVGAMLWKTFLSRSKRRMERPYIASRITKDGTWTNSGAVLQQLWDAVSRVDRARINQRADIVRELVYGLNLRSASFVRQVSQYLRMDVAYRAHCVLRSVPAHPQYDFLYAAIPTLITSDPWQYFAMLHWVMGCSAPKFTPRVTAADVAGRMV
jgi:hypothetical protein